MSVMDLGTVIAVVMILGTAMLVGALLEAVAPVLIVVVASVTAFSIIFTIVIALLYKK